MTKAVIFVAVLALFVAVDALKLASNQTLSAAVGASQASLIEIQVKQLASAYGLAESPFYYEQYGIEEILDKITNKIAAETAAQNKKYDDNAAAFQAEFNARVAANAKSVADSQSAKDASAAVVQAKQIILDAANNNVVVQNGLFNSAVENQQQDDPQAQAEFEAGVAAAAAARDAQFAVYDKEVQLVEAIRALLPSLKNDSPSLLQTKKHQSHTQVMLIQVNHLAARHGVAAVPVDNAAEVSQIEALLDQIMAKISSERAKVQAQYDADFARLKTVRDARIANNQRAVDNAKAALDAAIIAAGAAQGAYDAAVEQDNTNAGRLQGAKDFQMADDAAAQSSLDTRMMQNESDRQAVLTALRNEQDVVNAIYALLNSLNEGKDPCSGIVCVAKSACHNVGSCNKGVCSEPAKNNGDACTVSGVNGACNGGQCVINQICNSVQSVSGDDRHTDYGTYTGCDSAMTGQWIRFTGAYTTMPTTRVAEYKCGTHAPGWLNGAHPTVGEGVVTRNVCYAWSSVACNWNNNIQVLNCGGWFAYKLIAPPFCSGRYCTMRA